MARQEVRVEPKTPARLGSARESRSKAKGERRGVATRRTRGPARPPAEPEPEPRKVKTTPHGSRCRIARTTPIHSAFPFRLPTAAAAATQPDPTSRRRRPPRPRRAELGSRRPRALSAAISVHASERYRRLSRPRLLRPSPAAIRPAPEP
ncbi:hypothetical protein PVAP13_1KG256610 [Panicum virgatum]|uniref:Uncharacterized protein n=1 Tax=Panicum virgatum TaxID=38727 RepID=A0A8T0XEH9_PANVG|nr:hypothetical protein PVAP13_1KG256610 [Panicum virgatum]